MELPGPPSFGEVAEGRSVARGVDVHPAGEVAADGVEEPLGVGLPNELPRVLRAAGELPPPCPVPTVGPLVDAGHWWPPAVARVLTEEETVLNTSSAVLKKSSELRTSVVNHGQPRTTADTQIRRSEA